ncbi:PREDICTED: zinc metalloproteinase nas-4-like [Nicrophorus vespilloides]|uniref:Metalloendopeptidase n=1 Tax=Nicrophorus vespilloides TaxID=110193 RepID=A0ABM1M0P2_NICVS|nr:PREDICTED: zinc metalloproteinase nas-4-like [Nicrophorus vespilloides]
MLSKGAVVVVAVLVAVVQAALIRDLSPEQIGRLSNWKEGDKQNVWEVSGQYQGDIVLNQKQRNGLIHEVYRWPDNEVPYEFDPSLSEEHKKHIAESVKIFEQVSCVKARPKRPEDGNYIYITNEPSGCWSYVGRQSGKQIVNFQDYPVGEGCFRSATIQHEFLHAIGFYHQQSSTERDDFVEIVWKNIKKGTESNFDKYDADEITNFGEKYDYGSVMHYGEYAFSDNGEKTIVPKDPNAEIGQRVGLSPIDIAKLNKMYGCQ